LTFDNPKVEPGLLLVDGRVGDGRVVDRPPAVGRPEAGEEADRLGVLQGNSHCLVERKRAFFQHGLVVGDRDRRGEVRDRGRRQGGRIADGDGLLLRLPAGVLDDRQRDRAPGRGEQHYGGGPA
jgi:hypothetical protein